MRYAGVALSILTLLSITQFASAMQVTAPYIAKIPTIDGMVTPDEIAGAARITMTLVGGLDRPKYSTSAYLFINDQGLYVGYVCDEPAIAKLVQTTVKENGAVFEDDSVQLFLSPTREATKTNYHHFAVNAGGVKYSNCMQDDAPLPGWQAASSRGTKSWEAEMFIPFSAVRGETDVPYWRMNMARHRPVRSGENAETSAWINPGASLHNYKRFGFLQLKHAATSASSASVLAGAPAITTATAVLAPASTATLTPRP